jgi:hypothetical protein
MWLPRLNRRGGWTEWRRDNKWWHIILLLDYMSPSPSPSAQECAAAVAPPGCDPTPTGVGPSRRPARSERERRHVCERHSVKERMMGRQVAGISSSSGGSSSRRGRQAGAWWPPSRRQSAVVRGGAGLGGGDTASCRLACCHQMASHSVNRSTDRCIRRAPRPHPAKVASQHTAALFRRGRPLLLGAWAGVWKLPDWKFLPMSDYYSQTEQNEKK